MAEHIGHASPGVIVDRNAAQGGVFRREPVVDNTILSSFGRCWVTPPSIRKNHRRPTDVIDPVNEPAPLLGWVVRIAVSNDRQIERRHA